MSNYSDLLGRPYLEGKTDCFALVRDFLHLNTSIRVPNIARPTRFWEDPSLDLYMIYKQFGWTAVSDNSLEIGDVLLMPFFTSMNTHAGIIVDDNLFLHHLPNRLSEVDRLRPRWQSRANLVIRHPDYPKKELQVVQFHEVLKDAPIFRNRKVQDELENLLGAGGGSLRSDPA